MNKLLLHMVMRSTFRSMKFKFTVRPLFIHQVEVLCFNYNTISVASKESLQIKNSEESL
jgi:hypothetical protein